jgi:UDP-N-acetylmuramoylalanine--D-glutamate ligase
MIPVSTFSGRHVALFGLGGSGLATARALIAGGCRVSAWDDSEASRNKAVEAGVDVVDLNKADWKGFDALILSPGVPLTHPEPHWTARAAQAAGVEIIGDIELFFRERAALAPDAPVVCITGTNGKSTTTALIAHILRTAGRDAQMGGNIGVPALDLEPPARGRVHVIECSTFQIDLAPSMKPSVGVLLNLTPDHIDRHGTMENYSAVKERMILASDIGIIGAGDEWCRAIAVKFWAKRPPTLLMAGRGEGDGVHYADGRLYVSSLGRPRAVADLAGVSSLRGAHNWQNAAAAYAACSALGLDETQIQAGLRSFPGLAHRMELVSSRERVLFVNDSKATNADAAEKALLSFRDIHWIIGGKAKEGGIEPLRPLFDRVAKAYLIGASAADFARTLEGVVAYEQCGTLDVATESAARDAAASEAKEPVVLLSPACASYDQFANFEKRGEAFRAAVARVLAAEA